LKKLIGLTILFLVLSSLSGEINRPERRGQARLFYGNFNEINSFEDIAEWIGKNVRYANEYVDHWDDPKVTVLRGYGDCDDYAILFMNIAYVRWGIELDFVAVNRHDRQATNLEPDHAEIRYGWNTYSIYTGRPIKDITYIYYMYTFDEMFRR